MRKLSSNRPVEIVVKGADKYYVLILNKLYRTDIYTDPEDLSDKYDKIAELDRYYRYTTLTKILEVANKIGLDDDLAVALGLPRLVMYGKRIRRFVKKYDNDVINRYIDTLRYALASDDILVKIMILRVIFKYEKFAILYETAHQSALDIIIEHTITDINKIRNMNKGEN